MSQLFKTIMISLVVAAFILGASPVYAIFGIRAARTAIAARKAKQTLAKDPNADTTKQANENLVRLEEERKTEAEEGEHFEKKSISSL